MSRAVVRNLVTEEMGLHLGREREVYPHVLKAQGCPSCAFQSYQDGAQKGSKSNMKLRVCTVILFILLL